MSSVGVVRVLGFPAAGHAEDEQAQRLIDLWCGQADAGRVHHRLHHVSDEAADFRRAGIGDRIAFAQQDRVPHAGNFQNSHMRCRAL